MDDVVILAVIEGIVGRNRGAEGGKCAVIIIAGDLQLIAVGAQVGTVGQRLIHVDFDRRQYRRRGHGDGRKFDRGRDGAVGQPEVAGQHIERGLDRVVDFDQIELTVAQRDPEIEHVAQEYRAGVVFAFGVFEHLLAVFDLGQHDLALGVGQLDVVVGVGHRPQQQPLRVGNRRFGLKQGVFGRQNIHFTGQAVENQQLAGE
ncbi:hypothetical protein SDC9_121286 [bioreactor metagenome]|uniref:Uncharacterized protein n=1 Tax=bioreactor metagenome TaxID=1076179 RepID=A0A645CBJ6_9ZZZZ